VAARRSAPESPTSPPNKSGRDPNSQFLRQGSQHQTFSSSADSRNLIAIGSLLNRCRFYKRLAGCTTDIMALLEPLYKEFRSKSEKLIASFSNTEIKVIETYFLKAIEVMNETTNKPNNRKS
jgi:hypothetical protein